jgi:integrase
MSGQRLTGATVHVGSSTRPGAAGWASSERSIRAALAVSAPDRITRERVRLFVEMLQGEVRPSSVALSIGHLLMAARAIAPDRDWKWLMALKARLDIRAKPIDRFENLVPPWFTLDHALEIMDEAALRAPDPHRRRETIYRDGLILALLSLWPIRRRSLAALTISQHLILDADRVELLLFPEDTKTKRSESWPVPDILLPYFRRYLSEMRPRIYGSSSHDGLWASSKGNQLCDSQIAYAMRRLIKTKFAKPMGLHDFRRTAGTHVALEAPEMVGITPGILQHAGPEVADQHYNLARGIQASRAYGGLIKGMRKELREVRKLRR